MQSKYTSLAQLIAQVESSNDQFAYRFEPAYTPRNETVDKMQHICNCSVTSAKILSASSFGLYQIMGFNLIDLGLELSPLKFCMLPELQTQFFNEFLAKNGIMYTLDEVVNDVQARLHFAKVYNGDEIAYASDMMRVYSS